MGAVVIAVALPFDARTASPTPIDALWVLAAGASGLLAYVCLFYAFEHGRLTLAVPIMSSWAVIAAGLSLAIFREPVRPLQLVGAAGVVAGAVIVSRFAQSTTAAATSAGGSPRWLLASFGAALGFGVLIPLIGLLTPTTGRLGVIPVVYGADIAHRPAARVALRRLARAAARPRLAPRRARRHLRDRRLRVHRPRGPLRAARARLAAVEPRLRLHRRVRVDRPARTSREARPHRRGPRLRGRRDARALRAFSPVGAGGRRARSRIPANAVPPTGRDARPPSAQPEPPPLVPPFVPAVPAAARRSRDAGRARGAGRASASGRAGRAGAADSARAAAARRGRRSAAAAGARLAAGPARAAACRTSPAPPSVAAGASGAPASGMIGTPPSPVGSWTPSRCAFIHGKSSGVV